MGSFVCVEEESVVEDGSPPGEQAVKAKTVIQIARIREINLFVFMKCPFIGILIAFFGFLEFSCVSKRLLQGFFLGDSRKAKLMCVRQKL